MGYRGPCFLFYLKRFNGFRLSGLADCVFQAFAGLESRDLHSGDLDLLGGVPGVYTRAGSAFAHAERAETGNGDTFAFFKFFGNRVDDSV